MKKNRIKTDIEKFILHKNHRCVMAQSVFILEKATVQDYEHLVSIEKSNQILKDLENYNFDSNEFKTFTAVFRQENIDSEKHFEEQLWQ